MDEVRIQPNEPCDHCGEPLQDGSKIYLVPVTGGNMTLCRFCRFNSLAGSLYTCVIEAIAYVKERI